MRSIDQAEFNDFVGTADEITEVATVLYSQSVFVEVSAVAGNDRHVYIGERKELDEKTWITDEAINGSGKSEYYHFDSIDEVRGFLSAQTSAIEPHQFF